MLTSRVFQSGNTAVITGGASGIGLAFAKKCVGHGMEVVIADNDGNNLEAAKSHFNTKITTVHVDVSRLEDFQKLKSQIESDFQGRIDLLVLNAGIGLRGSWDDSTYFRKIMDVNLFGVIHGLNVLLPLVTRSSSTENPSRIIITGSKQGITNPPGNPAYNASKAAVKALAEHLSFDLSNTSPTTSVHLLIPGWTFTGLSGNKPALSTAARPTKPLGAWTPEQVVEYSEVKIGQGSFYVVCPDNDVSEEMDKNRVLWAANDIVQGRPPLTRWREDWKVAAEKWMAEQNQ